MDTEFTSALGSWNVFLSAVAGIAATLVGLLFVALGLNPRIMADDGPTGLRIWSAFTFHSFFVLLILGVSGLVPGAAREFFAVTMAILGGQGVVRVLTDIQRVRADPDPSVSGRHALLRFVAPGAAYLLSLRVAAGIWQGDPDALDWLVAIVFCLLISSLASCWELLKAAGDLERESASSLKP
jgi:hypothetical protein